MRVPLAHSSHQGGMPQELGGHLLNTWMKAYQRLYELGIRDGDLHSLTMWSCVLHDVGKATEPFFGYMSGKGTWAPHALYSTLAVAFLLLEPYKGEPWRRKDAERWLDDHSPVLYLLHHHHSGFKRPMKEFKNFLRSLILYLKDGTAPGPSVALVKAGSPEDPKLADFTNRDLHFRDGQPVIFERLLQTAIRWARDARNMVMPPALPLSKDGFEAFFIHRMAMGALSHGDCVDTANFYKSSRVHFPPLKDLRERAESYRDMLLKDRGGDTDQAILDLRVEVFFRCLKADPHSQIYLLTAPTGSGKTLASVAFAWAVGADQIVYCLPFLSIVGQTSSFLSDIGITDPSIGVLEHVSVPSSDFAVNDQEERGVARYRNPKDRIHPKTDWSHPLMISTTERLSRVLVGPQRADSQRSLALSRPSTLVVIDEAHSIPPHKLYVYAKLLRRAGCKVLLMTATPAVMQETLQRMEIDYHDLTPPGTLPVTRSLRRINWVDMDHREGPDLRPYDRVLSVYNTRRWAHRAFHNVRDLPYSFLVASTLCSAHRVKILAEVKKRLKAGDRCIVTATSSVEAGYDVDFERVYRMLSPLASIVQTCGRCNREGKLVCGHFTVWRPRGFSFSFDQFSDGPDPDYVRRANWLWEMAKVDWPGDDDALAALAPRLAIHEVSEYRGDIERANAVFQDLEYGYSSDMGTGDYCLIPRDERISAVVRYENASARLLRGNLSRSDSALYSVDIKPEFAREVQVVYAGEDKPSTAFVYDGNYDDKEGVGVL